MNNLIDIKNEFDLKIQVAATSEELDSVRIEFLGKKGKVQELLNGLGAVPKEERKDRGQALNELKNAIQTEIEQKGVRIKVAELQEKVAKTPVYDASLPYEAKCGSLHPITLITNELEDIFASFGFSVEDYSEVVSDFECFTSLNIPEHHPARDMQDTFYLEDSDSGQCDGEIKLSSTDRRPPITDHQKLLKTHTSAAQNSLMKKYGAPLRAIFPGRCFRNEATDATHENTFFQMEGMMIDEGVSISNLIYFMKTMLSKVFERDVEVRLRPGYFPFVEPGFELDIKCLICGGEKCASCKHSGWLELCPCGMIHPNVLKQGGIDTEKFSGFAFGLGLTRLAMMKYGVKDIRVFNGGRIEELKIGK
ncbi:MAG: phenylalanine--tRNA ligase subunit alpha [Firmicutes bacterium]|nr:phenylalanine--tRNA ligase subunit alpha [Bacillota bacterium]